MPITNEMKQYLRGAGCVAWLIRVVARDGTELRICEHTRPITYLGQQYIPSGFSPTQVQQTDNLSADNAQITVPTGVDFSAGKLRAGKWKGARVEVNLVAPEHLEYGAAFRKIGLLGATDVLRFIAKPEFRTLAQVLDQPIGEFVRELCDVIALGDARCGVDLDGYTEQDVPITIAATVNATTDTQQFTVTYDALGDHAEPDENFYDKGKVVWVTGANAGLEMEVYASPNANHEGTDIQLFLPMYFPVVEGDTLQLIAGCDRSIKQCVERFANGERNRSYYMLVGRNRLVTFPAGVEG